MKCWISATYGMFDDEADESGHDARRWEFTSPSALFGHLKSQTIRFVDCLVVLKEENPDGALATLSPEYKSVGYAINLKHESGSELSVGLAGDYWVVLSSEKNRFPKCDGDGDGLLVIYFHHWTEWRTSEAYKRGTAQEILARWFNSGVAA